jgi:O-antigen/teichoic acid export membrane protein
VKLLLASPTLRTVAVYGAAGAGFAAANLLLARALPPSEYALVTLVVALLNIGFYVAPAGLDGVVNRRHLEAGPRLLRQLLATSVAAGLLFGLIAGAAYGATPALSAMTMVGVASGGALIVAAGQFQSEQRFGPSLALLQSTNLVLFAAAVLTVATGARDAVLPVFVLTVGTVGCAVFAWIVLFRERHAKPHRSSEIPWREAWAFLGMQIAGVVLIQLERLVLPHLLPLHELATYGVLAAVAGSLFRVLQMGVGYSLLPRLRRAPDVRQRRRLVAGEARLVVGIVALGSAVIVVAVPLVERWFLAGKYHLTPALVVAVIVSGVAKVMNSFTKAAGTAVATPRELGLANLLGWLAVAVATGAAAIGARWGLAGVIYGVALGWALRAITFAVITARHLRAGGVQPLAEPAAG